MKRNKLIAISAITIAVTVSIAVSQGFGRSKIFMEIEAYERNEAAEQAKVTEQKSAEQAKTINTSNNSEVPGIAEPSKTSSINDIRCENAVRERNEVLTASQTYLAMGGKDIDPRVMVNKVNSLEDSMYKACRP